MWKAFLLACLLSVTALIAEEEEGHVINFSDVSMVELVKFVSRIGGVNFIADHKQIDFHVSFISGKAVSIENIIQAMRHLIEQKGLTIYEENGYYIIKEKDEQSATVPPPSLQAAVPIAVPAALKEEPINFPQVKKEGKFYVYKLQYHPGSEILDAVKCMSGDLVATGSGDEEMVSAINSIQWIKSTNSLLFSGSPSSLSKICSLIKRLDTALKQVFIEVLVIETNMQSSLDFGVQWSTGNKYKNRLGLAGSALTEKSPELLAPSGGEHFFAPGRGFDLGIIGDLIFHKGKSFFSLGALVSALQRSGESTIVLNQKIITQENKSSRIFVGDNIPFTGAVVQTIGSGQQTTANIEYRDIGVSLNITPLLGDNDIITLEISEEITEAFDHPVHKSQQLSGIKTSKTNMATSVHVPDQHFLILSGMTRSVKGKEALGPPCLGGVPALGALLGQNKKHDEKSNILIFVKPHIVNSSEEYKALSDELRPV